MIDTKISKLSWMSLEFVVVIVVLAISISSTSIIQGNKISNNTASIKALEKGFFENTIELKNIGITLSDMNKAQEIKNAIDIYKMGDRWTKSMMDDADEEWLNVLQQYIPELRQSDVPDNTAIQKRNGFGVDK